MKKLQQDKPTREENERTDDVTRGQNARTDDVTRGQNARTDDVTREHIRNLQLVEENNKLLAKLRGYEYLSTIFHETKRSERRAQKENEELRKKLQQLSDGDLSSYVNVCADQESSNAKISNDGRNPELAIPLTRQDTGAGARAEEAETNAMQGGSRDEKARKSQDSGLVCVVSLGLVGGAGARARAGVSDTSAMQGGSRDGEPRNTRELDRSEKHGVQPNVLSGGDATPFTLREFCSNMSGGSVGGGRMVGENLESRNHQHKEGSTEAREYPMLKRLQTEPPNRHISGGINSVDTTYLRGNEPDESDKLPSDAVSNGAASNRSPEERSRSSGAYGISAQGGSRSSGSSFTIISSSNDGSRKQSESERNADGVAAAASGTPGDFSFLQGATAATGNLSEQRGEPVSRREVLGPPDSYEPLIDFSSHKTFETQGNITGRAAGELLGNSGAKGGANGGAKGGANGGANGGAIERKTFQKSAAESDKSSLAPQTIASMSSSHEEMQQKQFQGSLDDLAVSVDIEQAKDVLLKAVGMSSLAMEESDLSVQITKNAIKVVKMEKEKQGMKALIENLSTTSENMKSELRKKDEIIQHLMSERRQVRKQASEESGHPSDLSGAPTSFGSPAQEKLMVRSQMEGEGREWVSVEKRDRMKEANSAMAKEIEELKKVKAKQDRRIAKLLEANGAWDKHCKQLEADLQEDLHRMKLESRSLNNQVQEAHLLAVKRQSENQDLRERVAELEAQGRRSGESGEAEARAEAAEERSRGLEQRLSEMQDVIDALNSDVRSMRMNSLPVSTHPKAQRGTGLQSMSRAELITQIEVLQQQVTVCTEDFRSEREDRARAQAQKDEVNTRLQQMNEQLSNTQEELRRSENNLEHMTRDKDNAERRLEQKTAEYNILERQLHAAPPTRGIVEATAPPPAYQDEQPPSYHTTYGGTGRLTNPLLMPPSPPPAVRRNRRVAEQRQGTQAAPVSPTTWSCAVCTFVNTRALRNCEMCDQPRGNVPRNGPGFQNPAYDGEAVAT